MGLHGEGGRGRVQVEGEVSDLRWPAWRTAAAPHSPWLPPLLPPPGGVSSALLLLLQVLVLRATLVRPALLCWSPAAARSARAHRACPTVRNISSLEEELSGHSGPSTRH